MSVTGTAALGLLVGRIVFGGTLAFMGFNHFMQREEMAGYAEFKWLPAPTLSVLASGAVLVAGGLALIAGVFPVAAALALAGFLVVAAVTMHNFWAVPEDQQQDEMTAFLKNLVMAGGAVAVASVGTLSWEYALDIGLF
ncbi:DoxX family protein [Halovenus salina]|uniref:DoxX family protein n=1 Tax=Halovenus salina TaxID=1510225 RepID=A0ABD5VX88_9EURY|nr:DoxX family protein [Halovenus salina]